jgi:hypothetical protein
VRGWVRGSQGADNILAGQSVRKHATDCYTRIIPLQDSDASVENKIILSENVEPICIFNYRY